MFSTNQRVKRLQSVIEKDGFNQGAHFMLGEEFIREGRFMQAAAKFRRVVELNPDHAQAWMMMGRCYDSAGIPKEAVMAYGTAAYQYERKGLIADAELMRDASAASQQAVADGITPFRDQF